MDGTTDDMVTGALPGDAGDRLARAACDQITNPALVPFDPAVAPDLSSAPRFAADGT